MVVARWFELRIATAQDDQGVGSRSSSSVGRLHV
jgi:hypothetical protein